RLWNSPYCRVVQHIQTMAFPVATAHRFVVLIFEVILVCGFISYLPKCVMLLSHIWTGSTDVDPSTIIRLDHGSNSTHAKLFNLPIPDSKHRVVTMSSLHYLEMLNRLQENTHYVRPNPRGIVGSSNRTIVLRYRTNISTGLEPPPDAGHLSAIFMGRTGNRMLIYAGLYGVARRNGMRHVISAKNKLLTLFKLNATVVQKARPGQDWVQYVIGGGYDKRTEYLDPRTDVELVGFFSDWKYRQHVMRDLVQNHFRFRDAIQQEADKFLRHSMTKFHLSPSDVVVIAVHIRRTDLLHRREQEGRTEWIAGGPYFRHAVAFFNRLFKNKTMYVVCSDDIEWAKVNFIAKRPTVFSIGHSADVDFAILSCCNHSIITTGTFGSWSAYLAGGVTVYHNPGSPTEVPLGVTYRKANSTQDPMRAWIALS
ncbi:MAG: alpha-1,2-fucosyltransferase, partial [Chromatiales bacterium]